MKNTKIVRPLSGKKCGRPQKYATEIERKEAYKLQRNANAMKRYEKIKNTPEYKKYREDYYRENKEQILQRNGKYYKANKKAIGEKISRRYHTKKLFAMEAVQEFLREEIQKHLAAFKPEQAIDAAKSEVSKEEFLDLFETVEGLCTDVTKIERHLKWEEKK